MRVAIVHDDLVQWGGAERVLEGICEIYPDAPIFTSIYDDKQAELKKVFGNKDIRTSFLQKIFFWKNLYKLLLPFYPLAFEQFDFTGFDLVISHTTRFAKNIITKPGTLHISYCHTPPRFLWNFSGGKEYKWLKLLLSYLRIYDQVAANRVDYFIAGSFNARERIKKIYKKESVVVQPFVDLDRFSGIETFDGGYVLSIARLNDYKRIDLVIKACVKANINLKIIGDGPDMLRLKTIAQTVLYKSEVEFLGNVNEELLIKVLSGARYLIIPGVEDFGLTSLEAQALGKPVIAYDEGGVKETIISGKTGVFFKNQNEESVYQILMNLDNYKFDEEMCRKNAEKFSKDKFVSEFKQVVKKIIAKSFK